MTTNPQTRTLDERASAVFGADTDPMSALEARARELLPDHDALVWEADASTFVFSYIDTAAERVLGFPLKRWTAEPTFWADVVVHSQDRDTSVSFCATETARDQHHNFEYRANTADGRVVRLRDIVRIIPARAGSPKRLRGVMVVVPDSGS